MLICVGYNQSLNVYFMMFSVKGYASALPQDAFLKEASSNKENGNVTSNNGNSGQSNTTTTTVTNTTPKDDTPEDAGKTTSGATSCLISQVVLLALIPYFLQLI